MKEYEVYGPIDRESGRSAYVGVVWAASEADALQIARARFGASKVGRVTLKYK